ncbi:hypothetical protein O181_085131 [Austropuccinia psidii MF-1]|uniref:Peptidase A2 domain-containing protein n=1 Tax=Austropuccinia psidii MF-1 TaxID=1389203 RepID=A0A9Q3FSB4_9BASI|nr:hypothetical protein [Austropuccinia psidii MF-1]
MEIFIGKEEYPIKELVDTGAERKIILEEIAIKASLTTRNLNINLRGIGGNTTSLVKLSELTPIILASGEETQIHFFIAKQSDNTVLGRPFLADNNTRLEFSHKKALGWKTSPPRGMELCNMEKLVRNNPGKNDLNAKRDNTMINLTQKTQELSISPKSDKYGPDLQNNKWRKNLKRQLEDSTSEDELTNIIYKPIDKDKETFQILVDGNEKINGNPFKTKPKRTKVRFSEHHELSDEEIINEIKKDLIIMEERDKKLKETYHINFLDRPLNNQEEPYEWQLENPEFIQQTTNEEDETESILVNEHSYIDLPYITFEDIYGDESEESLCEDEDLCHLPGANLKKIQFLELLTEEGIQGNLSNPFWD